MNTAQMAAFLSQVSQAHPQEFLVMVVDGASSHKAKELIVPENVRLIRLPGYSPELNPQEHIWDEVRGKAFPNLVLDRMAAIDGRTAQKRHDYLSCGRRTSPPHYRLALDS